MPNGFQTWKDILEVIIIPIALALIAYAYPEIQNASPRRKFINLIFQELHSREKDKGERNGGSFLSASTPATDYNDQ